MAWQGTALQALSKVRVELHTSIHGVPWQESLHVHSVIQTCADDKSQTLTATFKTMHMGLLE